MSETDAAPVDPGALIRTRMYRVLLVFAAVIGVVLSLAGLLTALSARSAAARAVAATEGLPAAPTAVPV